MSGSTAIADFYAGRSVFITGATGFMGKVLVEKLLRSCPDLKSLYLLMRPSADKSIVSRREELVSNPVFSWLRENAPEMLDKIVPVAGDVTMPGFGISSSDLQLLLDNVSIVFNSAATVRFDEELKEALQTNVKGPRQLLALARQMKHLEAFVHVSTVFNNLDREEIEEVIYPPRIDPAKLIDFLDCIDPEVVRNITPQLIGTDPNTYTFTKALAEQILQKECGNVPLVIVRPSVVTCSAKEPMPGWIDNIYGPTGVIAGGGKGFLRFFRCEPEFVVDIIPVDYSINLMIAVAWHTATHKPSEIVVYNGSSGHHNPITFGQMKEYSVDGWIKYPAKDVMWCPSAKTTRSSQYFRLNVAITHYVPAYFFDLLSRLRGKRGKLVSIYDRVYRALSTLDFFYSRQWRFVSHNPDKLWATLSAADRKVFYFDVRQIDWRSYFEKYVRGVRLYILKEDPKTLPVARKKLIKLYLFKVFVRLAVLVLFVWTLARNRSRLTM